MTSPAAIGLNTSGTRQLTLKYGLLRVACGTTVGAVGNGEVSRPQPDTNHARHRIQPDACRIALSWSRDAIPTVQAANMGFLSEIHEGHRGSTQAADAGASSLLCANSV